MERRTLIAAGLAVLALGFAGTAGASLQNAAPSADHAAGPRAPGDGFIDPVAGDSIPRDPDRDRLHEDVNGNGRVGLGDPFALFQNLNDPAVADHLVHYDFNDDDRASIADAFVLFRWTTGGYEHAELPVVDVTVRYADTGERIEHGEVVEPNRTLVLDASGSFDPDGGTLTYEWSHSGGETATGPTTRIGPLEPGSHGFDVDVQTVDESGRLVGRSLYVAPAHDTGASPATALNGSGTATDPYEVASFRDLRLVDRDLSANYELVTDVDASRSRDVYPVSDYPSNSTLGFDPIGDDDRAFTGTFDGNGHVIADLTIRRADANRRGLFGTVGETGTVERVGLRNVTVAGSREDRNERGVAAATGGLVGRNAGTVRESFVTGRVAPAPSTTKSDPTGLLVGWNDGTVVDAYARPTPSDRGVSIRDYDPVGALVGVNRGRVERALSNGTVHTKSDSYGGGPDRYRAVGAAAGGTRTAVYHAYPPDASAAVHEPAIVSRANATGANAAETLDGLAFGATWRTTDGYPVLAWQENGPGRP